MRLSNRFLSAVLLIAIYSINVKASLSVYPGEIKDSILNRENKTTILFITNSTSVLSYQLSADVDWINFNSTFGDINAGDTVAVIVTFNASLLYNGINSANIFLGDPHHGPITIPVEIYSEGGLTDVKEDFLENSPATFSVSQNYPNPFNPTTKIVYSLPETQKVVIKLFNVLGNEIMTLVDAVKSRGSYSLELNMNEYASGVYFYMIKTPAFIETKKMILNK